MPLAWTFAPVADSADPQRSRWYWEARSAGVARRSEHSFADLAACWRDALRHGFDLPLHDYRGAAFAITTRDDGAIVYSPV